MVVSTPHRQALAFAILVALGASGPGLAQEAPQDDSAQQDDEVVDLASLKVTAQKREEVLQDVPIALTALPEPLLRDTGVRDIKDVQILVPGLTVTSTQSEAQTVARIRGIGTVGDNAGLESSVGVVIDGVYRPRNGVGFGDLGELERIEVLKGPQGTVFGKNTSAGVIHVITRRPDYSTSVEGELTLGSYDAIGAAGAFNTALGDNAAMRVYAAKRVRDGFTEVRTGEGPRTQTEDGDQNVHTLRGQLLLEPTPDLDLLLIADYTSREEHCCVGVTTVRGRTAPIIDALATDEGVAPVADPFARVAWSNRSTEQDIKDRGVSLEANWITPWFDDATLTSITAVREWRSINGLDFDFTSADILYRNPDEDESLTAFDTASQEIRLTGSTARVDWMVGAFFSDEDLQRNETYRIGADYEPYLSTALLAIINPTLAAAPNAATFLSQATGRPFGAVFAGFGSDDRYRQSAKSAALFTNNTWRTTDALDLTVGLRYTAEDKQLDSVYSNPNGGLGCASFLGSGGQVSPTAVGRIAAALTSRGLPFATLPAAQQQAIVDNIVGFSCLPWANALHDGRVTRQSREEREWSGTFKAAYRWNEQVMTWASAARGYKAGGFNLDRVQSASGLSSAGQGISPVNDTLFPGEFVDSYEFGAKTTFADGDLLLNATLFHQAYSGFQLNSFLGTSFVVRSIPEVVSQGIDTELLWQPRRGLLLQGGVTYADTRYGNEVPGGDFVAPTGSLYKLPGNRVSFAPLWSASASISYEHAVRGDLLARFNLGAKYSSDYNTGSDLDVEKRQGAYTLVNARIGFGPRDRRWSVELWAQNLFDTEYVQVGFDAPLQNVSPQPGNPFNSYNAFLGAPRTVGVTARIAY